ncbi:MAG: hypothetical protein Q8L37_05240 [Candidatus Gottesmanbacteria bacterium]|nr:hypothetical protein [Candidatus Gottesmanbacteria bacterium]
MKIEFSHAFIKTHKKRILHQKHFHKKFRVIYYIHDDTAYFVDIGTHAQVYG